MKVVEVLHDVGKDAFRITLRPCWFARVFGAADRVMRVHRTQHGLRMLLTDGILYHAPHGRLVLGVLDTMPVGIYVTTGYAELPDLPPGVPAEGPT